MTEFQFYFAVYLAGRAFWIHSDSRLKWPSVTVITSMSVLTVFLTDFDISKLAVTALYLAAPLIVSIRKLPRDASVISTLLFGAIILYTALGNSPLSLSKTGIWLSNLFSSCLPYYNNVYYYDPSKMYNLFILIMIVTSEYNIVIRYILGKTGFIPLLDNNEKDTNEYRAGRFIGILERLILLLLFINGSIGAVGLVVAAKGLIRFTELKDKNFAEYFLLGTLLSITGALSAATLVNSPLF